MEKDLRSRVQDILDHPSDALEGDFMFRGPMKAENLDALTTDEVKIWGRVAGQLVDEFGSKTLPGRWYTSERPVLVIEDEEHPLYVFPYRSMPVDMGEWLICGLVVTPKPALEEFDTIPIFAAYGRPSGFYWAESPLLADPQDSSADWQNLVRELFVAIKEANG